MTTLASLVAETYRRLMPAQLDLTAQLDLDATATAPTVKITGPMTTAVAYGMLLSVGLEILYVTDYNRTTGVCTVVRGFAGSTPAAHSAGALVWINPKFTAFDIVGAMNEELAALSGPDRLFAVKTLTIAYNPAFKGYDFPFVGDFYEVLAIRYKIATPTRNYPKIHRGAWEVVPYMTDPTYPSGNLLVIHEAAFPGLPMHVFYACSFTPVATLADTVSVVSGLQPTALDLLPIGTAVRLVLGREVKRNFMEAQPDPRKAPEVPPGAVVNSTKGLEALYISRLNTERAKLRRKTGQLTARA